MRIRGWKIDGFGVFRGYEPGQLSPGLNLFWGPNEAGKTTLLAFLRGMFFGFPLGEPGKAYYPPVEGKRHGGRIELELGNGDILTVERYLRGRTGTRVTFSDGRRANEADLRRLLGGIDERLFRSVFAFSLTELQAFSSLDEKEIQEHLYSATLAGEGRAARQAIEALSRDADAQLPARGDSKIAELVRELEAIEQRITRETIALARRPDFIAEEARLARVVAEIDARAEIVRRDAARSEQWLVLWPTCEEIAELHARLQALHEVLPVPADAASRHAAITEKLRAARTECEKLHRDQDARRVRRDELALRLDDAAYRVREHVPILYEELGVHRQTLQRYTDARERARAEEEGVARALAALGAGWDEARIRDFVRGGATAPGSAEDRASEARGYERELRSAIAAQDGARNSFARQASLVRQLTAERSGSSAEITGSEPPSLPTIEARERAARRARASLAELRGALDSEDNVDRQANAASRDLTELEAQTIFNPPLLLTVGGFVLGVAAVAVAGWLFSQGNVEGAALSGALAVGMVAAVVVFSSQRRRAREARKRLDKAIERRRVELDEARAKLTAQHDRVGALRRVLDEDSRVLGVAGTISYSGIENELENAQRLRDERARWEADLARSEEIARQLQAARQEEDRLAAEVGRTQTALRNLRSRWQAWLGEIGLDASLDPGAVLGLLERIDVARRRIEERDRWQREADSLAVHVGRWETEAQRTLHDAGDRTAAETSGGGLIARFLELRRRLDADREVRSQHEHIEAQIADRQDRRTLVEDELRATEDEQTKLYLEIGATDEQGFFDRLSAHETRTRLTERITEKTADLDRRIDATNDSVLTRRALAEADPGRWREIVATSAAELEELRRRRDISMRQRGDTERGRRDLEESLAIAQLELEREGLRTELADVVYGWRATTLAKRFLEETLRDYETHRQPRVLAEAEKIFRKVTGGRYVDIRQSPQGDDIFAVDENGKSKSTRQLSRGTAEQLYLSLRLALVREFATRGVSLPLVMDDVLVNFDPERAQSTARTLVEFSKDQQILIFSCQPQTAEILRGVSSEVAIHELGESGKSPRFTTEGRLRESLEGSRSDGKPTSDVAQAG
jgi:uncharacterized protein YhaN